MKIAPVSADLLIKAALVLAAAGAIWYGLRQVKAVGGAALESLGEVADQVVTGINPASPDNFVNRAVEAVGGSIVSDTGPGRNADGSWTVGGWLYDVTHRNPLEVVPPVPQVHSAYWKS